MANLSSPSHSWFRSRAVGVVATAITAVALVGVGGAMLGQGSLSRGAPSEYARLRVNIVNVGLGYRMDYVLSMPDKSYTNDEIAAYLEFENTRLNTAILNEMAHRGWTLVSHSMAGMGDYVMGDGNHQPVTEEYIFAR